MTGGLISATSTVTGSTLIGSVVTASGNVTGGNVLTGGLISATANITGGNLVSSGQISAAGNVNIGTNYYFGNGSQLTGIITSVANINNGNSNVSIYAAGANVAVSVGNVANVAVFATTGEYINGLLSASGNVTGGNLLTGGLISATSTITSAANISGGNLLTGGLISSTGTVTGSSLLGSVVSVTGAITGGSVTSTGLISTSGNIAGGNILSNNYYYANGQAIVFGVNYTAATTPPSSPANGWQWYNTTTDVLYEYLSDSVSQYWVDVSSPAFAAGVVANVAISGSLLVNANAVYDIGSSSQTFANVYAQNYYGNGASLSGIITSVSNINNGTSNMTVVSSGGNITTNIGGVANVGVWYNGGLSITGDLSVSGNATLSGNILGDRIQNGTTLIDIQTPNGNANITIGGTANTAVFSSTALTLATNLLPSANITYDLGSTTQRWKDLWLSNSTIYLGNAQISANATAVTITNPAGGTTVLQGATPSITGSVVSASGNVTGGNILTGGLISATGNITANNISVSNIINSNNFVANTTTTVSSSANISLTTSSTFNQTVTGSASQNYFLPAATGLIVGTVWLFNNNSSQPVYIYYQDASLLCTIAAGSLTEVQLLNNSTTNGTWDRHSFIPSYASWGLSTLAMGGANITGATNISGTGNITGANLVTGGLITATGNITGAYIIGNGSQLTGLPAGYTNANLASLGSNVISTSGNVTSGNFLTGGLISATGNVYAGNIIVIGGFYDTGDHLVTSTATNANIVLTPTGTGITQNNGAFSASGNVTGGNLTTAGILTVNSGAAATAIVNGASNAVGNIGSASTYFNRLFAQATTALYADLAENYVGDADYAPGTVVDFGGTQEVTISTVDSSKRVAGVVSTNPAHLMNAGVVGEHVVTVALIGRVPVSVTGTVRKGDLMVSAGDGTARAVTIASPKVGTIIGKSLEDFDGDKGTIEIVIGKH